MFIRVRSKLTGHQFDIHESRFDPVKHVKVRWYPPSKSVRTTKFNARR